MSFLDHGTMPFDEGYIGAQEDPTWMEYEALEDFPATQVVSDEPERPEGEKTQDAIPQPVPKAAGPENHDELILKLKPQKKRKLPMLLEDSEESEATTL